MAQLDFFLDNEDVIDLVEYVLKLNGWFVPNILYSTPEPIRVNDVVSYLGYKEQRPSFFILSNAFLEVALQFDRIQEGTATGKYFIKQRSGGPTIFLSAPGEYTEGNILHIAPGMLSYHSTYWDWTTGINRKTPSSLKKFYSQLKSFIKDRAVTSIPSGFLISEHALKAFNEGARLMGGLGATYRPTTGIASK
jgi:hypothetical protein